MRKILIVAAVIALFGPVSVPAADHPNLIIISVDAMRPDHMGCFGYGRSTTPTIDAVAARGTMLTDVSSLIPLTNPSMSTFFTSHVPAVTGVKRNGANLNPSLPTMQAILKQNGYTTAAVQGCWALYHYRSGLEADFDYYLDQGVRVKLELDSEVMTERSLALMDKLQPPFFFWSHYPDAHQPHQAVPGFEFNYGDDGVGLGSKTADNYDSELAFVDHQIQTLLSEFERRGLLDNTIVVIMSDHGEELGERGGYIGHGRGMYQTVLHIPFIVAGPGVPAGAKVAGTASMLDLAPTLLSLLGLPAIPGAEGRDLAPAVLHAADPAAAGLVPAAPPIFSETYGLAILDLPGRKLVAKFTKPLIMGLRDGNHKIFFTKHGAKWEYYDLAADPGEQTNLYGPDHPEAREMAERLNAWYGKQYREPLPVK